VASLSGGNQQKVLLARWLALTPRVLILDEPTRGIDMGVRAEIYRLIDQLTSDGVAILLISSEIKELLLLSDRVAVMREGRLVSEFSGEALTELNIGGAALGHRSESPA
jgi:ABC-type sugar transport system ATPase subunit